MLHQIRGVSSGGSDDQVHQELMVEAPAMVGLGLCSAAIHDSLFTALELSALKPRLVRPVKESICTVTYHGHHVRRVLTRSDGKVHGGFRGLSQTLPLHAHVVPVNFQL